MQVLLRGRQRVNGGWRAAVTRLETRLRESGSNIMNWTTFRNQYKPAQLSGQLYSFVIFSHPLRSVNGTKILALQTWTNHSLDWQVIFLRGQRWKEYSRYPNEPRKIRAKVLKKVYSVDSALKLIPWRWLRKLQTIEAKFTRPKCQVLSHPYNPRVILLELAKEKITSQSQMSQVEQSKKLGPSHIMQYIWRCAGFRRSALVVYFIHISFTSLVQPRSHCTTVVVASS